MGHMDASLLHKLNLLEVLKEEALSLGQELPPEVDDTELDHWTEADILTYYAAELGLHPASTAVISPAAASGACTSHAPEDASKSAAASSCSAPSAQVPVLSAANISGAAKPAPTCQPAVIPAAERMPAASEAEFAKWFPGLKMSGTATLHPRANVLCWPSSGNCEDMYTSQGTGARRAHSPLLSWCQEHGAQLLAVQPPGRAQRMREAPCSTLQELAEALLPVVGSVLQSGVPYVVVGHSMGAWAAYEFLLLARARGLPMPAAAFLSAMPSPDTPLAQRPWTPQRKLDEAGFQAECRAWDINEAVFQGATWTIYQPLLRADFKLFDEYEWRSGDQPPFSFPIFAFWGGRDRRVTLQLMQGWRRFTTSRFELTCIQNGNHLWPLDKAVKGEWLQAIVQRLNEL